MPDQPTSEQLLELFPEPAFILDADARVVMSNGVARQRFAHAEDRPDFVTVVDANADEVARMLRKSLRSPAPLPTDLTLGGRIMGLYRVTCQRLTEGDRDPLFAVRFIHSTRGAMEYLSKTVADLRTQMTEKEETQRYLEAALSERDLLLREMQHRIKNNIQVQNILLSRQARSTGNQEFRDLVDVAVRRLTAIGQSYEYMYMSGILQPVRASVLLNSVVNLANETDDPDREVTLEIEDDWAVPPDKVNAFVLVFNEVLVNAYKHGMSAEQGAVTVRFSREGEGYRLTVRDLGAGFPNDFNPEMGSGLDLVQNLCGKLGGRLEFENRDGAVCHVVIGTTR